MDITLFKPHEGQRSVIEGFANSEHKFGVVSTGRQFGKSLLGQNLLLYWLLSSKNEKGAWISPIYNQAKKVFQELVNASHDVILHKNKADLTITFINGSTINFLSAERYDSIRGFSFSYVIIDEGAFIRETALTEAILPTMTAIGKKCLIISTPKSKNWFYTYWLKGQQYNTDYISFTGTSYDNPYADINFIDEQKISLPTDIFRQEYMAEFTDAGSEVFRNLDIVCSIGSYENENKREGCYVGIDTGLSSDYSTICIMSGAGRVLYMEKRNGENITNIAQRFISILGKYDIRGGYIETNGIGRAMADLIIPKFRKIKGFTTTQESKMQIVRLLIEDMEQNNVMLPSKTLNSDLYREMALYTYKMSPNGKLSFTHPSGEHDDLVDALMMSNKARNTLVSGKAIYVGQPKDMINIVPGFQ